MVTSGVYDFLDQDRVIFGRPAAEAVMEEAARLDADKLFIVASKTVSRKTDVITNSKAAMGHRFAGLFDECIEHVPREAVIAAAEAVRAADPDLIVTVGGGTPIDTVKVLQIALAYDVREPARLGDYRVRVEKDGKVHQPVMDTSPVRQIIVPTTLSGGEFSDSAGCTDTANKVKEMYGGRSVAGRAVILDPAVTIHTPEWLWLSTGIRALDHAVEGICSRAPQPFTDGLGLHALRLFAESLRRNRDEPGDLDARLSSQQAVWLAGSSLNRAPYGASHGIGQALGAATGVSHGYTSCVLLPTVLRYNAPVNAERQTWVAEAMGRAGDEAPKVIGDLIGDLGLPRSLRDVDVKKADLEIVARNALENRFVRSNPRPLESPDDVMEILEAAW